MGSLKDKVAIIGVAQTKFGENFDMSYEDMAIQATYGALEDAGVRFDNIDAVFLGTFAPEYTGGKGKSGASFMDIFGLGDYPVTRVTNYCATGTEAFRMAAFSVASGEYDIVLALGVEKMRDVASRESLVRQVAVGGHPLWGKGITAPGMFAMHATRYMATYGFEYDEFKNILAQVAVKNHYHGSLNPLAHFRKEVSIEKVLGAPYICRPLGLFDCCPTTDGAAAAIVTRTETAEKMKDKFVVLKGMGLNIGCGDRVFFDTRDDLLNFKATQGAARQAYEEAGITDPLNEIDLAEIHDCFTITEILNYEDLGFAKPGEGWKLIVEKRTYLNADITINPSGGLKSCGHPIGATGLRMITEVCQHLLGRAGERQVKDARLGLIHNLGGAGSVASVIVLGLPG